MNNYHETVMVEEALEGLHINTGLKYIDATLGNGGHSLEIINKGGIVLGIEIDPEMLEIAKNRVEGTNNNGSRFIQGNFKDLKTIAKENSFFPVSGALFDLGVNNLHLKNLERGFSFENKGALLDMRLNRDENAVKGSDLLSVLREDQLTTMFAVVLNEGAARWLSKRVVEYRKRKNITTVGNFLEICDGLKLEKEKLNSATLPFLALRIAVNSELDNLREALPNAYDLLVSGGRLVVITFHSGEDVIVKNFFKEMVEKGARLITYKPVKPNEAEIMKNRRARSAKIRVLEKI